MPSEIFHRNFWATFMVDTVGMELRHRLNLDHVMWSTDYPHTGSDWPNYAHVTIERAVPRHPEARGQEDAARQRARALPAAPVGIAVSLLRFLGIGKSEPAARAGETKTIRAIAAKLERLPPETARFLAAFAYVLARVAHADLEIARRGGRDAEHRAPARRPFVRRGRPGGRDREGAGAPARRHRELRGDARVPAASPRREQRAALLECLYAVTAADGTISSAESREIANVAEELGFTRAEANALRTKYREKLGRVPALARCAARGTRSPPRRGERPSPSTARFMRCIARASIAAGERAERREHAGARSRERAAREHERVVGRDHAAVVLEERAGRCAARRPSVE